MTAAFGVGLVVDALAGGRRHDQLRDGVVERTPSCIDRAERLQQQVRGILQREQRATILQDDPARKLAVIVRTAARHKSECSASATPPFNRLVVP